jgi:hypothetical protein
MPTNLLIDTTNINNMLYTIVHGSDKSEDMEGPYTACRHLSIFRVRNTMTD